MFERNGVPAREARGRVAGLDRLERRGRGRCGNAAGEAAIMQSRLSYARGLRRLEQNLAGQKRCSGAEQSIVRANERVG